MPVRGAGTSSADPHIASPHGSSLSSWVCSSGLDTWRTLSSLPGMYIERAVCWRNPRAHRTPGRAHQEYDGDRSSTSGSSLSQSCPLVLCDDAPQALLILLESLAIYSIKFTRVHSPQLLFLQGHGLLRADLLAAKAPDARVGVNLREVVVHA
jgi:hypothetical protein